MISLSSIWATGFRPAIFPALLALLLLSAWPARTAPDVPFPELLDRIGTQAENFWNYLPSVTCTEDVTQVKLGVKGKPMFEQRESYDYLILLQSNGMDISVNESRVEKTHSGSKGIDSLLETNGFSIFTLIFHPLYQSRFQFRPLPDEMLDGRRMLVIAFQQVRDDHPLSVLRRRDQDVPLEWRGTAWIDPESLSVVRIQADLGDSLADSGLLWLKADVTYADVHFAGATAYWLPARAVIEAETKRQHWRNIHAFSDYKRFSIETEVKIGATR